MARDKLISGTRTLDQVIDRLRARLPSSWTVSLNRERTAHAHVRAALRLDAPDGGTAVVRLEVAPRPLHLGQLLDRLRSARRQMPGTRLLAVAPYFSPTARTILSVDGFDYADATGNLRIALDDPALYIEAPGADRDPWPDDRPLRSLRGGAAGRAVRAFCDFSPPYGIRDLAERTGVPRQTLSRVAEFMEREGILQRERRRGPIVAVDWRTALLRWSEDYGFTRSNHTSNWLEPRGLPALQAKLGEVGLRYAITGSLAANLIAPITAPRLAALYVENAEGAAGKLRLRPAESGANVLLAEPFDAVALERGFEHEGLRYAAHSQIAVDLMTGPGRWPAEGEAVMAWMQANERTWRS